MRDNQTLLAVKMELGECALQPGTHDYSEKTLITRSQEEGTKFLLAREMTARVGETGCVKTLPLGVVESSRDLLKVKLQVFKEG